MNCFVYCCLIIKSILLIVMHWMNVTHTVEWLATDTICRTHSQSRILHLYLTYSLYFFTYWYYNLYISMYITMCLYITITILLWALSIYPFIKHYTILVSIIPYNLVICIILLLKIRIWKLIVCKCNWLFEILLNGKTQYFMPMS